MNIIPHTPPPHMERVVVERDELSKKLALLNALLTDQPRIERLKIDQAELRRLRRQYDYMRLYRNVLDERLEAAV